jgi:hypothetical protein
MSMPHPPQVTTVAFDSAAIARRGILWLGSLAFIFATMERKDSAASSDSNDSVIFDIGFCVFAPGSDFVFARFSALPVSVFFVSQLNCAACGAGYARSVRVLSKLVFALLANSFSSV